MPELRKQRLSPPQILVIDWECRENDGLGQVKAKARGAAEISEGMEGLADGLPWAASGSRRSRTPSRWSKGYGEDEEGGREWAPLLNTTVDGDRAGPVRVEDRVEDNVREKTLNQ